MDATGNLTSSTYWDERHPDVEAHVLGDQKHNVEYLFEVLDRHLGGVPRGGSIFELGCVPGQGLVKVARRYGLVPSGSDFSAELDQTAAVIGREFPEARFFSHDVGSEPVDGLGEYDVVMSGGLIEHFDDFASVVRKHADITRPGGLVVISAPNLEWRRALLWRAFDPTLYAAHNPRATDLRLVSQALEAAGCAVLERGHFGPPHVWLEATDSLRNRAGHALVEVLNRALAGARSRRPALRPFSYWIAQKHPA